MGQKVNPHGMRVGVIKDWDSRWFTSKQEFGDTLVEDHKIRKTLKKQLYAAGVPKIEIERTVDSQTGTPRVKVNVFCAKPGIVIGKGGEDIEKLRKEMEKMLGKPVSLNIIEIKRGCGSWECGCGTVHSLPFEVVGRSGSVTVCLRPAPRGIGLAVGDVAKSLLTHAGVHDSWGIATGNTKTKGNYCMATFDALRQTAKIRVTDEQAERLNIATGPVGLAGADEAADIDEQREE